MFPIIGVLGWFLLYYLAVPGVWTLGLNSSFPMTTPLLIAPSGMNLNICLHKWLPGLHLQPGFDHPLVYLLSPLARLTGISKPTKAPDSPPHHPHACFSPHLTQWHLHLSRCSGQKSQSLLTLFFLIFRAISKSSWLSLFKRSRLWPLTSSKPPQPLAQIITNALLSPLPPFSAQQLEWSCENLGQIPSLFCWNSPRASYLIQRKSQSPYSGLQGMRSIISPPSEPISDVLRLVCSAPATLASWLFL